MASLLDSAGIGQQNGPICPNCGTEIKPGAVLCTSCGLNFQTGQRVGGYQGTVVRSEFNNKTLQEAADFLTHDAAVQKRTMNPGLPWWVMLSIVLGMFIGLYSAVLRIQGSRFNDMRPEGTIENAVQRMPSQTVIPLIIAAVTSVAVVVSYLIVTVDAFKQKPTLGLAAVVLLVLFTVPYAIANRQRLEKAGTLHPIITIVFLAAVGWFVGNRGYKWF